MHHFTHTHAAPLRHHLAAGCNSFSGCRHTAWVVLELASFSSGWSVHSAMLEVDVPHLPWCLSHHSLEHLPLVGIRAVSRTGVQQRLGSSQSQQTAGDPVPSTSALPPRSPPQLPPSSLCGALPGREGSTQPSAKPDARTAMPPQYTAPHQGCRGTCTAHPGPRPPQLLALAASCSIRLRSGSVGCRDIPG